MFIRVKFVAGAQGYESTWLWGPKQTRFRHIALTKSIGRENSMMKPERSLANTRKTAD